MTRSYYSDSFKKFLDEEAIGCFDEAIRIYPEDSKAWSNKGDSLNKLGRYGSAQKCLTKAKELDES